jgi:hypothetical protein
MAAIRGLQTPQAMTTVSVSMSPWSVRTRVTRPSFVSMPVTSTPAPTVSAPSSWACFRIRVPASSESTTPTFGQYTPPRTMSSLMNGTSSLTRCELTSSAGSMPHDFDDVIRRVSSCMRSGVRATSMPPVIVNTPSSSYWRTLSNVNAVISFEWSVRKMKLEA